MSEKSMNEKNERNLDSTVDEIMEEIREQTVSEVKDINKKDLIGPCGEHGGDREETNIV